MLWWSPDPRAILALDGLHVSRRLARTLRGGAFPGDAQRRLRRGDRRLRRSRGHVDHARNARSLRAAARPRLGAQHGGVGTAAGWPAASTAWPQRGSSRPSRCSTSVTDASKVALVAARPACATRGTTLLDVQVPSNHLATLGARTVPRSEYLGLLAAAVQRPVTFAS